MSAAADAPLPRDWTCAELWQVADVQLGKMLDKKRIEGAPLRYLRNVNVRWGSIDASDLLEMPFKERELDRYSLLRGDVLVCEGGEPGRAGVWNADDPTIKYQKALHRVRMSGEILPSWLVFHLYFDAQRGALTKHFTGTTIRHFPREAFREYPLRIAPLPEQHRIVSAIESYFTRLDDAVATLERVRRNLRRYRASVLKAAVEGRLVPTEAELAHAEGRSYEPASVLLERILVERRRRWEDAELAKMTARGKAPRDDKWKAKYMEPVAPDTSELPELPEGWCWASCAQLLQRLQTGPFGSSLHRSDYVNGGTPVINPEHLQDYGIHPSDQVAVSPSTLDRLSAFFLNAGDIVLGRRGEMGRCALVGSREHGWLLGTGSLALRPAEVVDGDFLTWVLRSPRSVRTLEGESVGTTMTNLNQEILFGLPIPLAPTSEQARIAREIERHLSVINVLDLAGTAQRLRCARLRQSILKWAFEGRLVDQDPTDEPASVLLERIRAAREAADRARPVARRGGRSGAQARVPRPRGEREDRA